MPFSRTSATRSCWPTDQAAKARFEDRELLEQFQEVERLADDDKALVKSFLDAFLFKRKIQSMSAR